LLIEFGILESDEQVKQLTDTDKAVKESEKKQEDAEGEALEALKKGNVEIVASSDKK
jgi:nitrogenase iron protein NifH